MSYRFFFFKQKTAYEMRISDWSSDVCSSDLRCTLRGQAFAGDDRGDVLEGRRRAARPRTRLRLDGPGRRADVPQLRDPARALLEASGRAAAPQRDRARPAAACRVDRKSTRLNSSH